MSYNKSSRIANTTQLNRILTYIVEHRNDLKGVSVLQLQSLSGLATHRDAIYDALKFLVKWKFITKIKIKRGNVYYPITEHNLIMTKGSVKIKEAQKKEKEEVVNYCDMCHKIIDGDIFEYMTKEICLGCYSDIQDRDYEMMKDRQMEKAMEMKDDLFNEEKGVVENWDEENISNRQQDYIK